MLDVGDVSLEVVGTGTDVWAVIAISSVQN